MTRSWLLVADSSRARIYSYTEKQGDWDLEEELDHPDARSHTSELVTDQHGRGTVDADAHGQEEVKFARRVADRLTHGYDRRSYAQLGLVAPPHFLGLLRKNLAGHVTRNVFAQVDKDYAGVTEKELRKRLDNQI